MRVRFIAAIVGALALPACSYAPDSAILPDRAQAPSAIETILSKNDGRTSVPRRGLALRGTRIVEASKLTDEDLKARLAGLPLSYAEERHHVPLPSPGRGKGPPSFPMLKEGDRHFFDFRVTKDFAAANVAYVQADGATALVVVERILASASDVEAEGEQLRLLWRTSALKVLVHMLMGRGDLAEAETARTERFEIKAARTNISSRALRATVRSFMGDLDQAALDAIEVIKQIGDWRFPTLYPTPPTPSEQLKLILTTAAQSGAYIALGEVLLQKGLYKEASRWLQGAYRIMNDIAYLKYETIVGRFMPDTHETFLGRGIALAMVGVVSTIIDPNSPQGEQEFQRALADLNYVDYRPGKSMVLCFRAFALSSAGRDADAAREARNAVAVAEADRYLDYIWRLELLRGKSLLAIGKVEEAETALRHAQTVVDQLAGALTSDRVRIQFVSGKEEIVTLLARIDLRRNNRVSLFEDLERGRARAFVSMMAGRAVAGGRQESLVADIRRLDQSILTARQKKYALMRTDGPDREAALINQRQQVVQRLHVAAPDLAEVFQVVSPSLSRVQSALQREQAIVYYFELSREEPLQQMVIAAQSVQVTRLSTTPKALQSLLDDLNNAIQVRDAAAQKSVLSRLDQELRIADLNGYRQIYVVPSGPIHFVPWGGLSTSAPVAVLPTASWVTRSDKSNLRGSGNAALVGDPEFGGLAPQLPGARDEADAVGRIYHSRPLIGQAATETALRSAVGNGASVLHLATHALYDPQFPLKSALILTDGATAVPLTAENLFSSPLRARLVVLSACESGLGQVAAGEDILGLTRAFYFGGASAIVTSLWEVEDEPTKLFMQTFHEEARKGGYGNAWLAARNRLKGAGYPPSNYAPFIVNGSFN